MYLHEFYVCVCVYTDNVLFLFGAWLNDMI